jgi:hypothetical protein
VNGLHFHQLYSVCCWSSQSEDVVPTAERQKMASTTQMRSDAGVRDDVLVELKWDPEISPNSDFS